MRWRHPRACPLLGVAIALCLSAPAVQSQTAGISVSRRGTDRVEADPGTGITAVFLLRNGSARARRLHTHLTLPSGWRLITPDAPVVVRAHQVELRLLRLSIPGDAAPGTYTIRYTARTAPSAPVLAGDSLVVTIRALYHLEMRVMDAPELVLAGERYRTAFMVRNHGNITTRVRLDVRSSYGLPAHADSDNVHLAPGEARQVHVTVHTDEHLTHLLHHRLEIVARAAADSSAVAEAFTLVDVIPRSGAGPPRFHRLPVWMTLWTSKPGDELTGEIRASGTLTDAGADRLELLLRGPRHERNIFGDRDAYSLALTGNHYGVRLGDQSFGLSPLTETGRSGFGGGGHLSLGPLTVGGFAQRDRWTYAYTHARQRAGFLSTDIAGRATIGVNYLDRLGNDAAKLWSVHGVLAPVSGTVLDVEYGTGAGITGTGDAQSVLLTGDHHFAGYSVHYLHADGGYPGTVRGATYEDAALSIHPGAGITLTGRYIDRVTSSLPVFGADGDQHYRSMRGGIVFGSHLSAEYRHTVQGGGPFASIYAGQEDMLRFRSSITGAIGGIVAGGDLGRYQPAHESRQPFQRLYLQGDIHPTPHSSYSVSAERQHGSTLASPRSQDWIALQARAAFQPWGGTRFRVTWSGRRYGIDRPTMYGVLDAEWDQNLLFGHRLMARARVLSFGGTSLPGESVLTVGYTIPLSVPVSPSRRSGRLEGRIYDATTGRPIPHALVRVGDRAQFSDESGRVEFSGLTPDTYYVHVDSRGAAGRQIMLGQDPLPVHVGKLETTRFELPMSPGARVMGSVRIDAFARRSIEDRDDAALVDSAAVPNVIVSLTHENGTVLRRLTDSRGEFTFTGLVPGRWTLSMYTDALPEHHRLERDSIRLDVTPGDTLQATLRVIPERRTLHIIASVELTATPGSSRAAPAAPAKPPAGGERRPRKATPRRAAPVSPPTLELPALWHSYTVTRWDISLMQIARYMYGDASLWPKIWVANRFQLSDPDVIHPGQTLRVPQKAPLTREEREALATYRKGRRTAAPSGVGIEWRRPVTRHSYTVTRWDVGVMQIARYVYGDASLWPKIWVANQFQLPDPDTIRPGQTLLIPDEAPLTPAEIAARDAYLRRR